MDTRAKKLLVTAVIGISLFHTSLYGAVGYSRYRARESVCTHICRYFIKDREALNAELREAIETNDREKTESLITSGAQVHIKDEEDNTPLIVATKASALSILPLILSMKVQVNEQGEQGRTALHQAIKRKNSQAVQILLDAGADVTVRDTMGDTPLHMAVMEGDLASVSKLLRVAPSVVFKIKNNRGETVLDCAQQGDDDSFVELLEEASAKHGKTLKIRKKEQKEKEKRDEEVAQLKDDVRNLSTHVHHRDEMVDMRFQHGKEIIDLNFQGIKDSAQQSNTSLKEQMTLLHENQKEKIATLDHHTEHRMDSIEQRQTEDRASIKKEVHRVEQQSQHAIGRERAERTRQDERLEGRINQEHRERSASEKSIQQRSRKELQQVEKRTQTSIGRVEKQAQRDVREERNRRIADSSRLESHIGQVRADTMREVERLDSGINSIHAKLDKAKKGQMLDNVVGLIPVVGGIAKAVNFGENVVEFGGKAWQCISGNKEKTEVTTNPSNVPSNPSQA